MNALHFFSLLLLAGWSGRAHGAAPVATTEPVEELPVLQVEAGAFPMGEAPHAVLNSLEIVMTPGANADINRTLQTFPGVQNVDDGNALFVRGGDSFETATLVNGIRYPDAVRLDAPAGTYTGTINPFQAEKISFLAGGYGARYGNTLSAVVDLTTPGVPDANTDALNLSIGAVSLGANRVFGRDFGVRVTAGLLDLDPLFSLYAPSREFPEPPSGHDLSAMFSWKYRPGAQLRSFLIEQETKVGLTVNEPGLQRTFRAHVRNRLGTARLEDHIGPWDIVANVGGGTLRRDQTVGAGDTTTLARHRQVNVNGTRDVGDRMRLATGVEWNNQDFSLTRRIALFPRLPPFAFGRALVEQRVGAYAELEGSPGSRWLVAAGLRTDRSRIAHESTVDPRLRASWQPRHGVAISAAAGTYHQIADPYDYVRRDGGTNSFPAMRASHALLSVQFGAGERQLRFEAYQKDYDGLVELTRTYDAAGGGTGRARGVDLFAKSPLPGGWKGRLTWSLIDSQRTDPNTHILARSPQDITHTLALVADRRWHGWNIGFAGRYATGRPFTPVIGGVSVASYLFPVYGAPNSQRLPAMTRIDFMTSRIWALSDHVAMVTYLSINNLFNQGNTTGYEYLNDFAHRTPVPSLFSRTAYFGTTFLFR